MAAAVFDTMSVEIAAVGAQNQYLFRVSGSTLKFAGFLALYEEARDKVRAFIHAAESAEILFVRGTTEGINLVASSWGRTNLLPGDVRIVPFYDRTELVSAALWTVGKALIEGILLVLIVLFVFLGDAGYLPPELTDPRKRRR